MRYAKIGLFPTIHAIRSNDMSYCGRPYPYTGIQWRYITPTDVDLGQFLCGDCRYFMKKGTYL